MLVFPQLSSGASVQYPAKVARRERTVLNVTLDDRAIALYDLNAAQIRWDLAFQNLSDNEANTLLTFFQSCEGPLQPFLFCDPTSNLMSFSEDYSQSVWQGSALLSLNPGQPDPFGTNRATLVTNTSSAPLTLTQTVAVPGTLTCAFSVYLQGLQMSGVQLIRTDGTTSAAQSVSPSPGWVRAYLQSTFAASQSASCDFSLVMPPGASLTVFGFQLDAQPMPGTYVGSTLQSGVYPACRFDSDSVTVTATAPGQNNVHLAILSKANS